MSVKLIDENDPDVLEYIHHHKELPKDHLLYTAKDLLSKGELVAIPTETVYGLAANALDQKAVDKIYKAKGRPSDNPLIIHISSFEMLHSLFPDTSAYNGILEQFWPGPLTIILPSLPCIPSNVTGGLSTVAVRMPAHPVTRALIELCGFPLAAPSANTSGRPSPTSAQHVYFDFQDRIPLIIDSGICSSGVESTVLDALRQPPVILRPGGLSFESLVQPLPSLLVYGKDVKDKKLEETPTTPGMKYKHYSTKMDIILFELTDKAIQRSCIKHYIQEHPGRVGILSSGVGKCNVESAIEIHMGSSNEQVAHSLFDGLRTLEQNQVDYIVVEGVSEQGQGLAVMNRLRKAASNIISQK